MTAEFISAVEDGNILRVRIMLKDSLLVDRSFKKFKEMHKYAEDKGLKIWMDNAAKVETLPETSWNEDLMNLELTRLVNNFTKERAIYCSKIIKKVYGNNTVSAGTPRSDQKSTKNHTYASDRTSAGQPKHVNPQSSDDSRDYETILHEVKKLNEILKNNSAGSRRSWKYDDIESIQKMANNICTACDRINKRRK
ncbi:MAG: hypothetical protein J1F11_05540 [Oscillospiraceae bacterium]|nr:hypothetical protein [Oscillospiraceae bacterium]